MRRLKACVHIQAPVQRVRQLADSGKAEWMIGRGSIWLRTLGESWEATPVGEGTQFTLKMEYKARVPFMEPLMAEGVQHSVTHSLSRLKQLAEGHRLGAL